MAINFPDNAVDGQTFTVNNRVFVYNSNKKTWRDIVTTVTSTSTKLDTLVADITDTATVNTGNILYYKDTNWTNSAISIDDIYVQSSHRYAVTSVGTIYKINQIGSNLDNPLVVLTSGTTVSFKLDVTGHPFKILDSTGTEYSTGLVHVAIDGTVSSGSDAQGKESGTLYWQLPYNLIGNFSYQCLFHGTQNGGILVTSNSSTSAIGNHTVIAGVLTLDLSSTSNIFDITIAQDITSVVFSNTQLSRPVASYELIITLEGEYSINWGNSITWLAGTPPTLININRVNLITTDNASTFTANFEGSNYSPGIAL